MSLPPIPANIFLTADELEQLTGYERPADQARWLRLRAWVFEVNAQRRPIVLRAYAEGRLGVIPAAPADHHGPTRPNFDALKA